MTLLLLFTFAFTVGFTVRHVWAQARQADKWHDPATLEALRRLADNARQSVDIA